MPAKKEAETTVRENPDKPVLVVPQNGQAEQEKDLFVWEAASRPFKRRDREYYLTLFAMVFIVCLVLFFAEGWMPVVLIISLVFLYYILNTVAPETIEYKITTKGIKIANKTTEWIYTSRYWFARRYDDNLLIFETSFLPGRLELVIKSEDKDKIKSALKKYLPEEEASPSVMDKSAAWVSKKLSGVNKK
jgi:hypothetical protein